MYDKTDMYSIEEYAQGMIGKTFRELIPVDYVIENKNNKGSLGTFIEAYYFHYEPNSDSDPDFKEAGVELKTSGYVVNSQNEYRAKERLVLTMIDYMKVIYDTIFEKSHLWYKCQWMLLVFYQYKKNISRLDFRVDYAKLFTPSEQDLEIIKEDYNKIVLKIQSGRAHELSEADTMYLSAATKSANSSIKRQQPFSSIPAKPRAFSYKPSYMTYIFNTFIRGQRPLYESIAGTKTIINFEQYIIDRINQFKGKTEKELCQEFDIDVSKKPKHLGSILAFRMLGIKGNNAEEFVKSGITVKTIRLETNNKIKEHMSFPTFRFNEIAKEKWEDSDFYNTLSTTKFLFIIFQLDEKREMHLKGAKLWNMPYDVLENEVRPVWEKTKEILVHISDLKEIHNGQHYTSIFPKQTESRVSHVRPHARNAKDTYPLPDGREYPKQCFWLNNSYVLSVIKDD